MSFLTIRELRANQSRQTALDEGTPSPEQEGEKICRQGLDNSGNIEVHYQIFGLAVVIRLFHAVNVTSFPGEESGMITVEFITALFCEVDEQLRTIPKHPEAHLWPSEVVTLGLLHALKGVGNRPFYRWLTRDSRPLFPRLPERTRLFRLLRTHQDWTRVFLATPTVLGVIDTYGIELIHPMREGRSPQQIGRKGLSNHRWIVGGNLCLLLNQWGLIVGWACDTANVADNTFQWL